jgi:hypothetical protein
LFNSVGISEPEFLSKFKTIYSWDNNKGEIAQKTETVKRYSDVLENPLHELDDQIKEIEKLLGSEKFQSSEHRVVGLVCRYKQYEQSLELNLD